MRGMDGAGVAFLGVFAEMLIRGDLSPVCKLAVLVTGEVVVIVGKNDSLDFGMPAEIPFQRAVPYTAERNAVIRFPVAAPIRRPANAGIRVDPEEC